MMGQSDSLSISEQPSIDVTDTLISSSSGAPIGSLTQDESFGDASQLTDTLVTEQVIIAQDSLALMTSEPTAELTDSLATAVVTEPTETPESIQAPEEVNEDAFSTKKILWKSSQSRSLRYDAGTFNQQYKFVTDHGKTITLTGPKREWTFDIVSTDKGSLNRLGKKGTVNLNVALNGIPGKIQVKNTGKKISFIVNFREASESGLYHEFIINQAIID